MSILNKLRRRRKLSCKKRYVSLLKKRLRGKQQRLRNCELRKKKLQN
jgi:hypothetical protein